MDNNVNIGAGVALNVVSGGNNAIVDKGGSAVKGDGISIEAITPAAQTDNFIAWGAAAAGGKGVAQIAGSVGVNVITFNTEASARSGSYLDSSGGIAVTAIANLDPQTLAAAGAFSQGGNAIGATINVAVLSATTTAYIGGNADAGGAIAIDGEIHVVPAAIPIPFLQTGQDPTATSVAVAGAASSGDVAIGGSFIVNVFTVDAYAYVDSGSQINQGVSGVAGVTGVLYAPSASQTITISAVNETQITSIAGALGLTTGDAGVGIGLDVEILNKTTLAYIAGGAMVNAGGAVDVTAESTETMLSIAATAGVADEVGVAASISVAVISPETEAYIGSPAYTDSNSVFHPGVAATVTAGAGAGDSGGVAIGATDTFSTSMIAGSVGAAGTAGIGVANTTLVLSPTTEAFVVAGSTITAAGAVSITAQASENLITIAAGIAAGGDVGVAGSATVNVLNDTTTAYVGPSATITTTSADLANNPSNLVVNASDDTSVVSVAGSLAASGGVGAGIGADVGVYTKHTNAYIDSGVVATIGGNIEVTAESSESLISVSAGVAVGGDAAVGANAGVHIFNLQTRAFIGDDPLNPSGAGAGDVHAQGSISLNANDISNINEIVGVFAASGSVGVGAAVGVNVFSPDTESFIGAGVNVTGDGKGSGLLVDTGGINIGSVAATTTLDPSNPSGVGIQTNNASTMTDAQNHDSSGLSGQGQVNTPSLQAMNLGSGSQSVNGMDPSLSGVRTASLGIESGFHGVAVTASNRDEVRTFTLSLAAGGDAAVAVSAGVDVVNATTKAYIGDKATVNANTSAGNAAQSVLVGAGDDFYHLAVAGSVAGGFVGVGPAVGVNVITNTTEAYIGQDATVNALGDIAVAATGSENVVMVGFGIGAGAVGVGGAVDVLDINNTTIASIGDITFNNAGDPVSVADGVNVYAGGNVFVNATDDTHVFLLSGALAGGVVGVGGSVGVMIIDKNTDAMIGSSAIVDALGNTADESGVFNGALEPNGTFTAPAGNMISGGNFGATSARGVIVQAESSEDILHIVATGSGGFVGVSGAVGVTLIHSNTDAEIGANALINTLHQGFAGSTQSVYVNAVNDANVRTFIVGVAAGAGAVSGAVDVGTLNNNTSAKVDAGASVNARDNIEVNAVGIKNITGVDVSGAAGAVGLGGAVSVWAIGAQIQKTAKETNANGTQSTSGSALSSTNGSADDSAGSQAQSGAGTVTGGNGLGAFTTDSTGNGNTSQNRVQGATNSAATSVNTTAPTGAGVSGVENAAPTPAGTTAQMDGAATAGGDIGVTANDKADVTVAAGQVSVGVFGAGASVAILSVNDNVSALSDGALKAGGAIAVNATLNENVGLTVIDGSGGFVGIGAAVAVVTDNSLAQATLGDVTGAGAVSVAANSTRTINEITGQVSAGAVSAGASFTWVSAGGGADASVDAGATLSSIASLSVTAKSTITPNAETVAVSAGIGAFSANFSFVDVNADVEASIGSNATVDASGAVTVNATSTVNATADMTGVVVSESVSFGAMLGFPTIEGTTAASIGPNATVSGTTVTVDATSTNTVATTVEGASGGAASVSVMVASAVVQGMTQAWVGVGSKITGTLDVESNDTSTATPTTKVLGIGLFSGAGSSASAVLKRTVEAYIGNETGSSPTSQSTVTLNGSADVGATSNETANVYAEGASGGIVSANVSVPNAEIDGVTRAYVGPKTTVDGSASNSGVTLKASDTSTATVNAVGVSVGGLAAIDVVSPTATAARDSQAFIDAGGKVLAGGATVLLQATSDTTASASASGGGGGGLSIAAMIPTATISGATDAFVGAGGSVSAGVLEIKAQDVSPRLASADANVISIGVAAGAGVDAQVNISGGVNAYIAGGDTIDVAGEVSVNAQSSANPTSSAEVGQGGAVSVGVMTSDVNVTSQTSAYIGDNTNIVNAGSLDVEASDTTTASVTGTVAGGGIGEGRSANTVATVDPTITAYIGQYVQAKVVGDVSVLATSIRAQGNANSTDNGGGGVDVGFAQATVNVNPTVNAYIDIGSSITAGGAVKVDAEAQSTPNSGPALNDYIQGVSTSNGEITFPESGLSTGDSVTYNPNGNTAIQTANGALQSGGRLYNVVVVDPNTLQLGNLFNANSINSSVPFTTAGGVDYARDVIRFAIADNFKTGDSVVYSPNGNGDIGLTAGATYYVRVIDPYTIELYDTLAGAKAAADTVSASDVSGNAINIANSFTNGEAVTYKAPAPIAFNTGAVNVSINSDGSLSAASGANNILVGSNTGLQTGDAVVYHTNDTSGSPIGGLTNGTTYYVITTSDSRLIQLAASYADATAKTPTAITLTPDQSATGESYQEEFTQAPIGGLTDGVTYYVANKTSTSFQLAATYADATAQTPTVIALTAPGNKGVTHQFFAAGVNLVDTGATGQEKLYIDLTGAGSGTTQELLGPAGVSLRTISPPAGNGVSTASAKGGSGGGIEVSKPTAEVVSTYTVSAEISATLVDAGGNVTVSTNSQPNESAYAQNGSGGAINIGNAEADITFTNNNTTTIGGATTITAGGDFSMIADNAFNFTDDSTAQGGGFISSAASTANILLKSTTNANIDAGANITASSVDIEALISSSHASTTAEAQGGGLFGDVNANGDINGTSTANVTIGGGGTVIDGIYGVTIKADQNDFNVNPSTDSSFFIGIGPTITSANNNTSLVENVYGLAGSTIIAGPPSESDPQALYVEANGNQSSGGGSETHDIAWSTDVIIYQGASPWLVVDASGDIVKAVNVTVNGGNGAVGSSAVSGGAISVDPIANQGGSEAVFNSPGKHIDLNTTEPTFQFRDNFQQVLITNESQYNLVINEIDVIDRSLAQPKVELDGTSIGLTFLLKQVFTPTLVDISNFGAGNIVLQGDKTSAAWTATGSLIENPIGETRILNAGGNIVSAGSWAIIRTNTLGNQFATLLPGESFHGIQATLGSIGAVGALVNVQLVQSAGRNEQLYANAGGNVYLNLTGLLRDPAVSDFTVHIDSIVAGGDASVQLQSSLQQTTVSGDLGGVLVTVPPNSKSGVFYQQFTYFNPDSNPNTPLDVGVFGAGTTTIASTYDFRQRDNTLTPTTMPGVTAGGDISVTAANPLPTDPIINVYAITELSGSADIINVLTNGYITLMEETGDLRAGVITSTANDVKLYSPARIVDGLNDPAGTDTNVTGVNITLTAGDNNLGQPNSQSGAGGIGTPEDFLTIHVNVLDGTGTGLGVLNAFDTAAASTQGVFITETIGDLEVDTVTTNGDVSLATENGSILDARNGGVGMDAPANVIGNTIDLYALGGNIGDPSGGNDLKINSHNGAPGTIGAEATDNVDLTQVTGNAQVALIEALTGNIRFTVRQNGVAGEDLVLLNSGSVLFRSNTPETETHGLIDAPLGSVLLRVGGNVTILPNAQIKAGDNITVYGDFARVDELSSGVSVSDPLPSVGTIITVEGTIDAGKSIAIYGGINPAVTAVTTGLGDQIILWGSITAPETDVYAGSGINAGGGVNPVIALNPTNNDGFVLNTLAIAGPINLWGNASNDTFIVNKLGNVDLAGKFIAGQSGATSIDPGTGQTLSPGVASVRDTINLFGGDGSNQYDVNLTGNSDYIVNVNRIGQPNTGSDTLTINGVPGNDTFLLRQHFVALLQYQNGVLQPTYERINYNGPVNALAINGIASNPVNVLNVNALESYDYLYSDSLAMVQPPQLVSSAYAAQSLTSHTSFYVDGNSAITTLTGADGGDTFQFGQVFGSTRVGGSTVQFGDAIPTVEVAIGVDGSGNIVPGYLTSGPQYSTTAYGGAGNDQFFVYSNQAPLKLYGEDGNDNFVVRSFALAHQTGQSTTALTTIRTGNGDNQITYNVNAPVSIDGGGGLNTVTVLGSGFGDSFVITSQGVVGAGVNVSMTNVEVLYVDGVNGNNAFYVLSTAPGEVVTLIGGSGDNNTFDVAGDVTTPVIAQDINGVSGVINNNVISNDPKYNGIYAPGVSVNVASSAAGQVVIGQLTTVGASTPIPQLFENPASGPNEGQYTINLAAAPTADVYVTVAAALRPYQDTSQGSASLEVSTDGVHFYQSLVVTFTPGDYSAPQKIYVKAFGDNVPEGQQTIIVSHSSYSADKNFNDLAIANLEVNVIDQTLPDAVLTPAHPGNLQVIGGGSVNQTDSFTVQLNRAPAPGETVTVTLNSEVYNTQNYLVLSGAGVTTTATGATIAFNSSNWNDPVTVNVAAAPDGGTPFNPLQTVIEDNVTSSGGLFATDTVQHKLSVNVIDSAVPQVLVSPSTPITVTPSQPSSYTMQLTTQPSADVTVQLLDDGQTLLSSMSSNFTAATSSAPAYVTFNSSNWDIPVTITVSYNPNYKSQSAPGAQSQIVYPAQPQLTSSIQGPVIVEGYNIANLNLTLRPALMLPTETDVALGTVVYPSANTQATQTNTLNVFNAGSSEADAGMLTTLDHLPAADQSGLLQDYAAKTLNWLEFGNISGEDMTGAAVGAASSPSLTLNFGSLAQPDYVTYAGGVTYRDVQVVDVMLGSGNDTFTVNATPVQPASSFGADVGDSLTVIQGGGGDNKLIANGGGGQYSALMLLGSTTQDGYFYNSTTAAITGEGRVFNNLGNNVLDARNDPNPAILYGGGGNDIIYGGAGGDWIAGGGGANLIYGGTGNDIILGSDGFNLNPVYETPISQYEGVLESDVVANHVAVPIRLSVALASLETSQPVQVLLQASAPPAGSTAPDADTLKAGGNTIFAGSGDNIIVGDLGVVTQIPAVQSILTTAYVTSVSTASNFDFANNTIYGDGGGLSGIVWNGVGGGVGGSGLGNDVILGGSGANTIWGGNGQDIIIGNDGLINWGDLTGAANPPTLIESTDFAYGGGYIPGGGTTGNIIHGGTLDSIILGGPGDNWIWAGVGNDLVIGQVGQVTMDGLGLGYEHATLIDTVSYVDPITGDLAATTHGPGMTVAGNSGISVVIQAYPQADALAGPVPTGGGDDILVGGSGNSWIGGGAGSDLIFGNNVTLARQGNTDNPIFRVLTGSQIYTDTATTDTVNVANATEPYRTENGHVPVWADFAVTNLDAWSSYTPASSRYGNNYIAGGPNDNMIFGGQGDNAIQGAGSILGALNPPTVTPSTPGVLNTTAQVDTLTLNPFTTTYSLTLAGQSAGSGGVIDGVSNTATAAWLAAAITALPGFSGTTVTGGAVEGYTITFTKALGAVTTTVNSKVYAYRDPTVNLTVAPGQVAPALGALHVNPSFESATDGNNYIEGGGGNGTVIFGGTGQNAIIGGNSNLFSLNSPQQRPDSGNVIIFAGAGTEIGYNDSQSTATLGGGATAGDTLGLTISWISAVNGASMTETVSYTVQMGDSTAQMALGLLGAAQNTATSAGAALAAAGFTFGASGNEVVVDSNVAYTLTGSVGAGATETITIAQGGATVGTAQGNVHARNASVVVANNGDIYDLVGSSTQSDRGGFLTFNYDSGQNGYYYMPGATIATNYYGGNQFVIPRAVQLLDYTYGGPDFNATAAASNIGGTAEIHAESGDTQIYGGPNLDYLFGGSGNDLIIGGYGGKWISGGNGETGLTTGPQTINTTGILGSDGRLAMSRNGIAEPLYGIAAVPAGETLNEVIANTPGANPILQSTINVAGALTVTADLTPFNVDPQGASAWTTSVLNGAPYQAQHYDDIIYGGLGNAFIHGGPGSTAISGVQALPVFWNNPIQNPYNYSSTSATSPSGGSGILGYDTTTNQFAAYSEANPRTLISGFFLNFNQYQGISVAGVIPGTAPGTIEYAYAGAKNLFGDLGNDWIVGGNGASNLWGGFGNSLLDVRRNLTIDGGLNDVTDNNASPNFRGLAFAGAGINTLIAGGAYDRLIGWTGNFNTFVVPFAPWGEPTVTRSPAPDNQAYLISLGQADGADNLYADYSAVTNPDGSANIDYIAGLDPTRNGEPYGELGLVNQTDTFWRLQHGAPNQPPPGNIPGGARLVTGQFRAGSTSTAPAPLSAVNGNLSLTSSGATLAPTTSGAGSFAAFSPNDGLPNYFEMTASVTPGAEANGALSNGYLIFNYINPTNFDYAGVNATTGNIELGSYNGTNWTVEASAPAKITAGTTYNLFLSINGNYAILTVSTSRTSTTVNYAYPWNVVDGVDLGLNYGLVGTGTNNATATFNNIVTQVPIAPTTWTYTTYFGSGPLYFDQPTAGAWSTNGTGLTGVAPTGGFAITPIDPGLALTPAMAPGSFAFQNSSNVDIAATIKFLGGRAGIVFDYTPGSFNFAALLGDTNQVVLGHYTTVGGFVVDAAQSLSSIRTGTVLEIVANGDLVNVLVNGAPMLSMAYGEVATNFQFGLLSWTGSNTFSALTITTNDPAFGGTTELQVAATAAPTNASGAPLTQAELATIVAEADKLWTAALGPNDARLAALTTVTIEIGNLPGLELGSTHDGVITISANAAGWGWFVDPTPGDNSEFALHASDDVFYATPGSAAYRHMDLLSTVLHEMGNAMGFAEDHGQDVTGMTLSAGERRLPGDFDAMAFNLKSESASPAHGAASPWTATGSPADIHTPPAGKTASAPASIDWTQGANNPSVPGDGAADRNGTPAWLAAMLNQSEEDYFHQKPNAGMRFKTTRGAQ